MLSGDRYFGAMPFYGVFKFAHAGVDFFFVLSGFIIFHVHRNDLGNPARFGEYIKRRFVRIFPTYWTVLAFWGLILAVSPTHDFYERSVGAVLTSTFLIPVADHNPILGVSWTLQHEVLFYTLFSVLFFSRSAGTIVLSAWAALITWNMVTNDFSSFPASFVFRLFNIEFFFGIAVSIALRRWPIFYPRTMLVCGAIIFFGMGLAESWGPDFDSSWPVPHMLYATGAAMALYGMVGAEQTGRLGAIPKLAVTLGAASYSIYLFHGIVIQIIQQGILIILRHVSLPAQLTFVSVIVVTVIICERFSHFVEQPLLRWSRRALSRRPVLRA
jgi:peptidoglycan/LPS O-acetylase OafA/YrhL